MAGSKRVVSFGECMVELQGPAFGTLRQTFGGDTLNTAIYLARCGARHGVVVDYATALGDDPLSDGMLQRWRAEGLGTGLVQRLPGRMPGLYMIETDAAGERRFHYWRGEAAARDYFALPPGQTPLERTLDDIDALYFSGISLAVIGAAGRERLLDIARRLRSRGAIVAFDNNYRPRLWPDRDEARRAFETFAGCASIALLTLDDEAALWGLKPCEATARVLGLALPELVVKRGADSTLVRGEGQALLQVPTVPVAAVVDSTAAGDSFAGAYLAARLAGQDPEAAARAGNWLAARVVQHPGAVIPAAAMADLTA